MCVGFGWRTHFRILGTTNNAPEYYINMRTGTHYFPRGVNAVAAVERSRQKFGLNKIEETVGETMCTTTITSVTSNAIISSHRRTESCDLSHRRQSANNISSNSINCNGITTAPTPSIVTKEVSSLLQTNTHSRMSPDLQRHLAYQTYRGFECKSINIFTMRVNGVQSERESGTHNKSIVAYSYRLLIFLFPFSAFSQFSRAYSTITTTTLPD